MCSNSVAMRPLCASRAQHCACGLERCRSAATQVFRNFSLRLAPGKVTALVGESGSGKSTIISLIERFYDVQEGQVLVEGQDVRQLSLPWLRSRVRCSVWGLLVCVGMPRLCTWQSVCLLMLCSSHGRGAMALHVTRWPA